MLSANQSCSYSSWLAWHVGKVTLPLLAKLRVVISPLERECRVPSLREITVACLKAKQKKIALHPPKPQQLWEVDRRLLATSGCPLTECRKAENLLSSLIVKDSPPQHNLLNLGLQCWPQEPVMLVCCSAWAKQFPSTQDMELSLGPIWTVHSFHARQWNYKDEWRFIPKLYWHSPNSQGFLFLCYLPQPL